MNKKRTLIIVVAGLLLLDAIIRYDYASSIIKVIADSRSVIVEGLKKGKTISSAKNGSVDVSGFADDYEQATYVIYSNSNIIQLRPGTQERVAVSLHGGSAEDNQNFTWTIEDNDIIDTVVFGNELNVLGKKNGIVKVIVTHPKALLPYAFLVCSLPDTQNETYFFRK